MSDKTELLPVTQEDREAAADHQQFLGAIPEIVERIRNEGDNHPTVQAFARHRLATRPTPASIGGGDVADEDSRIFDLLEGIAERLRGVDDERRIALQAGFARGTGGVDLPYLIDKIASALAQPQVSGGDAGKLREALGRMLLEFEDFINEPPQYEDRYKVREYRHELYGKWSPLLRAIQRALLSNARDGGVK